MLKYYLRRVLYIVVVFFLVSIIMFTIYKFTPVDPVELYAADMQTVMTPAEFEIYKQTVRDYLGLDRPLVVQYFSWISRMLTGDFGRSLVHRQPVLQVIRIPLSNTLRLNAIVMLFVFAITIPLGITIAVRKGTVYDNTVQVITILGISLPAFITSLATMLLFAIILGILPLTGARTPGLTGTPMVMFLDSAKHMVMPIMVSVFTSLGGLTRYIRATMIEALRTDYVRTARAKGLTEKVVIYSHAFRNSLIPFVTILVAWFIGLFSGSVMIERIFLWNGMGNLFISSVMQFDYAVVLAVGMFYVFIGLIGNLLIDIIYTFVDPRIRLT